MSLRTFRVSVLHFFFVFERFRVRISEDLFPQLVAMVVCFPMSPDESCGRVSRKFTDASIRIFFKSFKTIPDPRADDIIAPCDRWRYPPCSSVVARQQNTRYHVVDRHILCGVWEIQASHSGFSEDPSLVSSYIAWNGEYLPMFRTRVLFPSSGSSTLLRLPEPEDGASTIRRILL